MNKYFPIPLDQQRPWTISKTYFLKERSILLTWVSICKGILSLSHLVGYQLPCHERPREGLFGAWRGFPRWPCYSIIRAGWQNYTYICHAQSDKVLLACHQVRMDIPGVARKRKADRKKDLRQQLANAIKVVSAYSAWRSVIKRGSTSVFYFILCLHLFIKQIQEDHVLTKQVRR